MSLKTTFFSGSVPCELLKTGQIISYHADDDGDLELGIAHDYTILSAGQYSGTTNIVINGKTHALSNNCVQDNRTGLMWARYVPNANIGPATDGNLFYKQWTLANKTDISFDAGTKVINSVAGQFHTSACCIGRKVAITGAGEAGNNQTVTVVAITGNNMTVSEAIVDEAVGASISFATVDDLIWNFLDQANVNSLGGHNDWRIPNSHELLSIMDISYYDPTIDTTVFPSTPSSFYWTGSAYPYSPSLYALLVYFKYGGIAGEHKEQTKRYIRLVRS